MNADQARDFGHWLDRDAPPWLQFTAVALVAAACVAAILLWICLLNVALYAGPWAAAVFVAASFVCGPVRFVRYVWRRYRAETVR